MAKKTESAVVVSSKEVELPQLTSHLSLNSEDRLRQDVETYCKAKLDFATPEERSLFFSVATARRLNPLANQIHAVPRNKKIKGQYITVMEIQTGIDGLRLIAERSDKYAGQVGPHWCGEDGKWVDVWLKKQPPAAARVGVLKSTFKEPLYSIALFEAYAQFFDGKPTYIWEKMGAAQLAKCAEALALRKAFPEDMGGLYTNDEMAQAEAAEPKPATQTPPSKPQTQIPPAPPAQTPAAWWIENAADFSQSVLNFGTNKGKRFSEIGAVELNNIMQSAINSAKDKSAIPKEFMDLAVFVENWLADEGEKLADKSQELTNDIPF